MQPTTTLNVRSTYQALADQVQAFFRANRYPILLALALRALTTAWLGWVWLLVDRYLPFDSNVGEATYHFLEPQPTLLGRALLDVWLRWDAVSYMNIAKMGYGGLDIEKYTYPPLYPYLTRWFSFFLAHNEVLAGLIVSTLASMAALVLLYRLVHRLTGDLELAKTSVFVFGIYPTAFFLFAPFTDSLFILLVLACFLSVESDRWLAAGLFATLACLARFQGVLLAPVLLVAAVERRRLSLHRLSLHPLLGIAVAPLGYFAYSLFLWMNHLPSVSEGQSTYWHVVWVNPLVGYFQAVKAAFTWGSFLAFFEFLSVTVFLGMMIWLSVQKRLHLPYYFLFYGFGLLFLFLSKYATAATPLQCMNRYVLSLLPVFIGGAWLLLHAPTPVRKGYTLFSITMQLVALTLYGLWVFVG